MAVRGLWQCCVLVVFVLVQCIAGNILPTHEAAGRACRTTSGAAGVCRLLPECPTVVRAIARGNRQHTRCGFIATVELVCCAAESSGDGSTAPSVTVSEDENSKGSVDRSLPFEETSTAPTVLSTLSVGLDLFISTESSVRNDDIEAHETEDNLNNNQLDTEGTEDRLFLSSISRNRPSLLKLPLNTLNNLVNIVLDKPRIVLGKYLPTPRPTIRMKSRESHTFPSPTSIVYPTTIPLYNKKEIGISTTERRNVHQSTFPLTTSTQTSIQDLHSNEVTSSELNTLSTLGDIYSTASWLNSYNPIHSTIQTNGFIPKPLSPTKTPIETEYETTLGKEPYEIDTTTPTIWQPVFPTWLVGIQKLSTENSVSSQENSVFTTYSDRKNQNHTLEAGGQPSHGTHWTSESTTTSPGGRKSQDACDEYRKIPLLTRYIIGGDYAAHGEFPHMAALGYDRPGKTPIPTNTSLLSWLCGGTLLNEEYVLTAAHCVNTTFGAPLAVRVGYTNLSADASTGLELRVRETAVHPEYDPKARAHDIALVRVDKPLRFSQFVHPACLRTDPAPPPQPLIVTGWGSITPDGVTPTDLLKKGFVDPLDDTSCNASYPNIYRQEMMCANSDDRIDTCKGDSGGPMQLLERSDSVIYTVVGVTSFGPTPCASSRPGVYTRVASYLPWIENIVWPRNRSTSD